MFMACLFICSFYLIFKWARNLDNHYNEHLNSVLEKNCKLFFLNENVDWIIREFYWIYNIVISFEFHNPWCAIEENTRISRRNGCNDTTMTTIISTRELFIYPLTTYHILLNSSEFMQDSWNIFVELLKALNRLVVQLAFQLLHVKHLTGTFNEILMNDVVTVSSERKINFRRSFKDKLEYLTE